MPHTALQHLEQSLKKSNRDYTIVLLSEVFPTKLEKFDAIEAYERHSHPLSLTDRTDGCKSPALASRSIGALSLHAHCSIRMRPPLR